MNPYNKGGRICIGYIMFNLVVGQADRRIPFQLPAAFVAEKSPLPQLLAFSNESGGDLDLETYALQLKKAPSYSWPGVLLKSGASRRGSRGGAELDTRY
jgi:hypothetical protein